MTSNIVRTIDDALESLEVIRDLLSKRHILGSSPLDYPTQFIHGGWECKDSPTGGCMYTNDMDSCIFCYEPDERK